MDTADPPHRPGRAGTPYVYATTLLRGRERFVLGVPQLRPPGHGNGWEVCAISYLSDGLMVSWRRSGHLGPEAGSTD